MIANQNNIVSLSYCQIVYILVSLSNGDDCPWKIANDNTAITSQNHDI